MAIHKKTQSIKTILMLCCAVGLCFIVGRWAWSNYQSSKQAQALLEEMQRRENATKERLTQVQARNELLETETGVQDFLIEKYAVKREGERVLVLVRDENERIIEKEEKEETFWQRMGRIFFE